MFPWSNLTSKPSNNPIPPIAHIGGPMPTPDNEALREALNMLMAYMRAQYWREAMPAWKDAERVYRRADAALHALSPPEAREPRPPKPYWDDHPMWECWRCDACHQKQPGPHASACKYAEPPTPVREGLAEELLLTPDEFDAEWEAMVRADVPGALERIADLLKHIPNGHRRIMRIAAALLRAERAVGRNQIACAIRDSHDWPESDEPWWPIFLRAADAVIALRAERADGAGVCGDCGDARVRICESCDLPRLCRPFRAERAPEGEPVAWGARTHTGEVIIASESREVVESWVESGRATNPKAIAATGRNWEIVPLYDRAAAPDAGVEIAAANREIYRLRDENVMLQRRLASRAAPPAASEGCDFRKPGCTNDGTTVDGVWRCSNHPASEAPAGGERESVFSERACGICGSIIEFPLLRGQKPLRQLVGWCIDCNGEVPTKSWPSELADRRRAQEGGA